ncbi:hypothetical protein B0H17DRAFT_1194216 [Mycena rosella]|uniref:Uncharacterized protein n=1 Tax=Mycena rosella TaxID=1033263 RepID=A0AAD7GRM4_MYCRO|nr:hypothetical protein B0H17DRAFT_1194216 [Mycena rosella]
MARRSAEPFFHLRAQSTRADITPPRLTEWGSALANAPNSSARGDASIEDVALDLDFVLRRPDLDFFFFPPTYPGAPTHSYPAAEAKYPAPHPELEERQDEREPKPPAADARGARRA